MDEVGETELLDAGRAGRVLDGADGAARRRVDAGLLRRCCHELAGEIDPRGVRLRNAVVTGRLDLAGLEVPFPLRFEECEFDAAPVMEGARLHELALTGCERLPGLLANGLRVRRDLDLSRSLVTGGHRTSASTSRRSAIWLCESDIGGRLLCVDTIIRPDGERSLQADRMHVGGTVRLLHQFTALGEIRLLGARIDGSLDFTGARIESSTGPAVNLGFATIGGNMFLIEDSAGRRPVIQGRLDMARTTILGQFLLRNATLREFGATPTDISYSRSRLGGTAVSAPRLSVGSELTLEGRCEVTGGLDLSMSDMSSLSIGPGCTLHAPGQTALDLTNAELLSSLTLGDQVTVAGTLRLAGARIHGNLSLRGARLSAPERGALIAAIGLTVDGDLELHELRAAGGDLRFGNTTLGGVVAPGAQLANPDGYTLGLHQATVRGSVVLSRGFRSDGLVMLSRSVIEGLLDCAGGTFTCPGPRPRNQRGHAIEAVSATIGGGMDLSWASVSPSVDFTNATTSFLIDDPANWPPRFIISGFTYDRFGRSAGPGPDRAWDRAARCAWLGRQAAHDPGPYEQAARAFRQHGYGGAAEEILMAQRRQARRAVGGRGGVLRRALDAVYGVTVGYGYRPGRVLWLIAALLVLVTASLELPAGHAAMRAAGPAGAVYTTADPCGDGRVRCFDAPLYAIDTVIPLISLDQRSTWYPDAGVRYGPVLLWWLDAATLLGWLLSSIFVLSFARLARSA